jgi:hypothetical protein
MQLSGGRLRGAWGRLAIVMRDYGHTSGLSRGMEAKWEAP